MPTLRHEKPSLGTMNDSASPTIAQAHRLAHSWGDRPIFGPLDLVIPAGVTLVQGDEQTGKTTLLRILAGELAPTSGWIDVKGCRSDEHPRAFAQAVFRTDPLNTSLDQTSPTAWFDTLLERYPLLNKALLVNLVESFDLNTHIHKPLYMLSAGSRRKVWLSAAFASGAALTLIDQPFAALDGPSMRLLREVLQDFSRQTSRACLLADYEPPGDISLASTIEMPNPCT